jgi:hypothetical protein
VLGGDPTGLVPGGTDPSQTGDPSSTGNGTDTAPADTPTPPSLPPQLQQLLDTLQSGQPSAACTDAIKADLTKLLTDIPTLVQAIIADLTQQLGGGSPPSPQQILDELTGLLGSSQSRQAAAAGASSPTPDPTVIFADLQQLVTDLTTKCAPKPPPAEGGGQQPQPQPHPQPQPQPQPVVQPVAQPVSYPGYAATGSIAPAAAQHPVDTAPLAALGGGVLLVSAAATAALRSRARRAGR